ncbi:hypothetical protein, partial [Faecalibacterium sp. An77]|uniref:hypothetical protein n=1 Tax=Faecalibacterium sp. An77 TaxID=1965655 RepID=UPI0031B8322B
IFYPCETSQISKTSKTFDTFSYFLTGQYFFTVGGLWSAYAKATGALLTRVTVVPTQPIKTLIPSRSERTVYIVSNSRTETKQAILPLSAPVSISMLLCFGNRHNHITVCDETILISPIGLYHQAMLQTAHEAPQKDQLTELFHPVPNFSYSDR